MNRVVQDGIRWELAADFTPLLPAVLAAPGKTVKESSAKIVTVHSVGGREYYVKRYRHTVTPFRAVGYLVRATPARREWRLARQMEQRGLPIVHHLALGEQRTGFRVKESILITEGFQGLSIGYFRDDETKLAAVVALVGRMHAAGVLQTDLHPGNILMNPGGELRLLDLDGATVKTALSPTERNENLAYLCIHLPLPVPPEIRAIIPRVRGRVLAARSERCFKANRDFSAVHSGGRNWFVRHAPWPAEKNSVLAAPDAFLSGAKILKAGRSSTVGVKNGLVLKRYNFRHWYNPAKDLFRPSKGIKNFQRAYHLELTGIRTARPLAAADDHLAGLPIRSFFVMEEIAGAVPLPLWAGDKRAALGNVAELMARLHGEGFTHRDLKDNNIVFDRDAQPNLIDLDGLRFLGAAPADAEAAGDLARLAAGANRWRQKISRTDRARFLTSYCRARALPDWRWWWKAIEKKLVAPNS
jgi:tRNA A-37 threonylcarbamoyl transferase component Bud32